MKVMVCLACDGGELDRRIMAVALKHAKPFGARVMVVNSQLMDDRFHAEAVAAARRELATAGDFFKKAGVDCEVRLSVRGIAPGEDIVKLADENDIDEIYVGLKKRSRLGKLLVGSTAQYLLLKSGRTIVSVK